MSEEIRRAAEKKKRVRTSLSYIDEVAYAFVVRLPCMRLQCPTSAPLLLKVIGQWVQVKDLRFSWPCK